MFSYNYLLRLVLPLFGVFFWSASCDSNTTLLNEESGYNWQNTQRDYWPTIAWKTEPMSYHDVDSTKMNIAYDFAQNDPLARAMVVIKDGYIVFEKYLGDGGIDKSTNLWSVTKSFASAIVGFYLDENPSVTTNDLMADILPTYPEFGAITLRHVLTMTTGLNWAEEGPLWVDWILSDDWVAHALRRGHFDEPGKSFKYSSGNSHFLTSMVHYKTGKDIGLLAKVKLFDPLGIEFYPESNSVSYTSWNQYVEPNYQSWRKDSKGIETASFGLYFTARDMAKFGYLYLNKGKWENKQLLSEYWISESTKEHVKDIYGRYSYGYQWYITLVDGRPSFLASGYGGQIIGVVPSIDLVVVLKYDAENPQHPKSGTNHDDMKLFELIVDAVE
jgi:CubicO group peptidase (beta-lactamase class C family)